MKIDERTWKTFQQHLGYNDEEMKSFRENPRNEDVLTKSPSLMNKTIVIKVVESHGCNSQHKVGDKFFFDGAGNLLTHLCPKRICIYALNSVAQLILPQMSFSMQGLSQMRCDSEGQGALM
jgi:uncharacterized repeat protein (TIGR04076 family)